MDPVRNPYTPGAGSRPPVLSGRDAELDAFRVLLQRLRRAYPEKSLMITGLRGVGKTVLLNTFESIAEESHFATAASEIRHESDFRELMARLVRRALLTVSPIARMGDKALRAAAIFKAFRLRLPEGGPEISVDVEAAFGHGDSGDLDEDLTDLIVALGQAASEQQTGVVFLLDEVQFLKKPDLEALIAALHRASQQRLPVTMVGAGLPQLPQLAGEAKSYAERLFQFPRIGTLQHDDACRALEEPAKREGVRFDKDATEEIVNFTEGYPYFLQLFGHHIWNIVSGGTITAQDVMSTEPQVTADLDDNFFQVRVQRCTRAEIDYLSAMAALGSGLHRSGEIATSLGKEGAPNVAPTRARLIEKGLIYSPEHGLNDFTVPQFGHFMRRNYPRDVSGGDDNGLC